MGEQDVRELDTELQRDFTRKLLADLRALELLLDHGFLESGVRRIGVEQELFLVDRRWRPAPLAMEMIDRLADDHFTTEVARFNLEFNSDPLVFETDCLSRLERQLEALLARAREAAAELGIGLVMVGILPTLEKSDLTLANMTPKPRYFALNDAMRRLRGGDYEFHIKGLDELLVSHDSVMVEACNTSFQTHFQVGPEEFAELYNLTLAIAAPVLAVACNSPLLFGRRLWRETRIALFQQSVDHRAATPSLREQAPRVSFGRRWLDDSVLEIFREDIARFRVLLAAEIDEDPFARIRANEIPELKALRLHNGTIYRWARPCYGIHDGRAHLRIENRILPAGPSLRDEMANAAFWYGLLAGASREYGDIRSRLEFDHAQENFLAAARLGLRARFTWLDGADLTAEKLVLDELLPLAREGLRVKEIAAEDADRYLGVIEERVLAGRTGAQWLLDSLAAMRGQGLAAERLAALTAATADQQRQGKPVHEWPLARREDAGGWEQHFTRVEQFMSRDLFTVGPDDIVDLAAAIMDWKNIHYVPVEDAHHRLLGLVTHRRLLRLLGQGQGSAGSRPLPVHEVMKREVVTATPEMSALDAMSLMRQRRVGCLPVLQGERLIGLVTENDFLGVAGQLLEHELRR
ncbi:MAG TPA: glutamate-cysteine ligase family protein [Thermoanaerobaculia bacterium]|jgi:CBS domain-containing protein/gamma-glutamylcysteine synthetase|nr:MAG: inosine 5'-monophosphate dehydrogenase [Acidobacteria bacterium ADurb.Bin051]HNU82149.1 glutamate-cysteine ligase family protein [Thermoanaerobaculia bacterium]